MRIVLLDAQQMWLDLLSESLAHWQGVEVVETTTRPEAARDIVKHQQPDLLISDLCFPTGNAFELADRLPSGCSCRFLVLTAHRSEIFLQQTVELNLAGYLLKNDSLSSLQNGLRTVMAGGYAYADSLVPHLERDDSGRATEVTLPTSCQKLKPRQIHILQLLAQGFKMREVAASLHITESAVENQVYRMMKTLETSNRASLVLKAVREGLVLPL